MKKHATALRAFSHVDVSYADKQVILNMEPGQFADWSADGVGLVREATAAEVATARDDKPATKKTTRQRAKRKAAAPAAPSVAPTPVPIPVPDAPASEA